jgi:membrane protein DedA with SNARE-associated domain
MRPGVLGAAALLVAVLTMCWRRLPPRLRALAIVLALALVAWGSGVIDLPNLETIARDVGSTLGGLTYLLVGVMALLETGAGVGLVAPGELAVVIGGVTAGQGHTDLAWLIAVVWSCAFAGDLTSYVLGRRLGRGFVLAHGHLVRLTPARLEQVEMFLGRHGGKTIIVGRFIGLVRAVAPFVAGSSRMPARRFIPATFIAAGIWSVTFCVLGYVFWQSFDQAAEVAKQGSFVLVAVIATGVILALAYRRLRTREGREQLWRRVRRQRRPAPHA